MKNLTPNVTEVFGKEADLSTFAAINVADCHLEWKRPDGSPIHIAAPKAPAQSENCFAVVVHSSGMIYREHRHYCHILTAWQILTAGRPAKWKTAEVLTTLRQALRERYVQPMPLVVPEVGITLNSLKQWLHEARRFDAAHHGQCTF